MTGWIVTSASASGWRRMWRRLRRATTQGVAEQRAAALRDRREGDASSGASAVSSAMRAGQGQEHVVERGLAQAEVVDDDAGVRERVGEPGDRARPVIRRSHGGAHRPVELGPAPAIRPTWAAAASSCAASTTVTWSWAPPTCRLRARASPRAITRPWSTTMMSSARRSASSRYCVVRSNVVPSPHERHGACPRARCARGDPGRWSARRGRAPRAPRRESPRGRAACACRRSRSSRAGRRRRRARTARAARRRGAGPCGGRGGGAR